jgi:hypothetical protein
MNPEAFVRSPSASDPQPKLEVEANLTSGCVRPSPSLIARRFFLFLCGLHPGNPSPSMSASVRRHFHAASLGLTLPSRQLDCALASVARLPRLLLPFCPCGPVWASIGAL